MKRNYLISIATALFLFGQGAAVTNARTEGHDFPTATSGAAYSIISTIIAIPVKIATCATLGVVGGVGHGLSAGESEVIQSEFLSAIPYACQPVLKTLPPDIDHYLDGPQPQDMDW
ncbi:MAG: hypothetical protein AB7G75_26175 [Candidatus Binatia bacterium]